MQLVLSLKIFKNINPLSFRNFGQKNHVTKKVYFLWFFNISVLDNASFKIQYNSIIVLKFQECIREIDETDSPVSRKLFWDLSSVVLKPGTLSHPCLYHTLINYLGSCLSSYIHSFLHFQGTEAKNSRRLCCQCSSSVKGKKIKKGRFVKRVESIKERIKESIEKSVKNWKTRTKEEE